MLKEVLERLKAQAAKRKPQPKLIDGKRQEKEQVNERKS
jgi:hypothetical protein